MFYFLTGWVVVGMFNIISQTIIQLSVSEEQLGMAMGTMIGVSTSIAPLGALLGGSLGVLFGSHTVMILFASLLVFVSVFWMSQSSIRELTDFEHIEWGDKTIGKLKIVLADEADVDFLLDIYNDDFVNLVALQGGESSI